MQAKSRFLKVLLWLAVMVGAGYAFYQWRDGDLPWIDEEEVKQSIEPVMALAQRGDSTQLQALNHAARCLNQHSDTIAYARLRYFSWIGDSLRGPLGNEGRVEGIPALPEAQSCLDQLDDPKFSFQPEQVQAYARALGQLSALAGELHRYYATEGHKDDSFRQGQRLHGPLLLAFERYFQADASLRRTLRPTLAQRRRQRLKELTERGRPQTAILLLRLSFSSRDLVESALNHSWRRVDPGPFLVTLTRFNRQVDSLRAAVPKERLRNRLTEGLPTYQAALEQYRADALALHERLQAQRPYTPAEEVLRQNEAAALVPGSPERLVAAYQRLVKAYNQMAYDWDHALMLVPISPRLRPGSS